MRRVIRRRLRHLFRFVAAVLILLIVSGTGGYIYFRRSLPRIDGTVKVSGLHAPVEIIRDTDAIPHIYAQNRLDALFGLGYVHAQDRLWQMEVQRRFGYGRLSEVMGSATLGVDRSMRAIGMGRAARSAWATFGPDARTLVDSYIAGVNSFIATHSQSTLSPEFTLLGVTPEPWSGPDVLVWAKMMAWNLGGNYSYELLRSDVFRAVGSERGQQVLAGYPEDGLIDIPPKASDADYTMLAAQLREVYTVFGTYHTAASGLGSNNWVVDGTKTTTGKPILANDPHLGTTMPGLWYLAHISYGDADVIGATIPGLPAVVIGRNRSIAWGMTNVNPDVQDLFRERLDVSGQSAEFDGKMERMQLITETIKVRNAPDVQYLVRITRHGPLLSDAITANDAERSPERRRQLPGPLALRWTALDPEDTTVAAFLGINDASNWEQFTQALAKYVAPSVHLVYADVHGNIGYYAPGHIPIRARGDGALPAEGWSGAQEWIGWIPFEALPHSYNPPQHVISTANERPTMNTSGYYLGRDWEPPYRAQRISELLYAKDKLSPADHAAIQGDTYSLYARALLPKLLTLAEPRTESERQAIDILKAWNGNASGDSAAAAIFAAWYRRLLYTIAEDELGEQLTERYANEFAFVSRFLERVLVDRHNPWCDDTTTAAHEDCTTAVIKALGEALQDLQARLGNNMNIWRWDSLHTVQFLHQPFDEIPVVRNFFDRSVSIGGDPSTINVGYFSMDGDFSQDTIPGYREIIDLSDINAGRFIQATGQSGHVLSPYYDDYIPDWRAVHYRPMRVDRAIVEQYRLATLRLEP